MYNRHTQVNQLAEIGEGSPTVEQSGTQTEARQCLLHLKEERMVFTMQHLLPAKIEMSVIRAKLRQQNYGLE